MLLLGHRHNTIDRLKRGRGVNHEDFLFEVLTRTRHVLAQVVGTVYSHCRHACAHKNGPEEHNKSSLLWKVITNNERVGSGSIAALRLLRRPPAAIDKTGFARHEWQSRRTAEQRDELAAFQLTKLHALP